MDDVTFSSEPGLSTQSVTDLIRSEILTGAFPAGCRIKLGVLADRFAISVMPVREALRTLTGEGLIIMTPNKGATVRKIDASFVSNLYEIRGVLEAMLAERACQNMTMMAHREILAAQESLEACVANQDINGVLDANFQFHLAINRMGGNPEALRMLSAGQALILTFRRQFGFQPGRLSDIAAEHRELVQALTSGDASRAAAISRMHARSASIDLVARLQA